MCDVSVKVGGRVLPLRRKLVPLKVSSDPVIGADSGIKAPNIDLKNIFEIQTADSSRPRCPPTRILSWLSVEAYSGWRLALGQGFEPNR